MDLYKQFLKQGKDLDTRLKALESTNQVQNIVIGTNNSISTQNGAVIDANGLNSTNNFKRDQIISASSLSTTSTSDLDLPGSSMNSFVLTRNTAALITVFITTCNGNYDSTGNSVQITVNDSVNGDIISFPAHADWSLLNIDFTTHSWATSVDYQPIALSAYIDLSAGTHTLKMKYRAVGGTTAFVGLYLLAYTILGA